jgi:uncharacterized damage-inducible protein DinB
MGTSGVNQLLHLLDEAFQGNREHSLMANLRSVNAEDWDWIPAGGARSIRDIVRHVGSCKYMYENHAFGDGSLAWSDELVTHTEASEEARASIDTVLKWLKEGHTRLRESIVALDDSELGRLRKTNWDQMVETRWIITVMIEHDLYHGGEINHLRALRQGNDRWPWDPR